ncbi:urease subunit beta [Clostridium thermobutyricum]|uniref:Urease subunit beta n=1 Tax=Clostridium thermobutyricum DSM 4928 TaxID=1121339 RepID=A0A1V4SN54_9CLOT|nr:urease subunit beta [Clostridium thermobutyricum]OPX44906.1 urease subunit beta [Clostridium thermobutyricum DSM 4928]
MIPGEIILGEGTIKYNEGREAIKIKVKNEADRPVQVGSHFHFYEVNTGLKFDREKAYGKRLDIPAGTAVRFEPGDEKEVNLIDIAGVRRVYGLNNQVDGYLDEGRRK